MHTPQQGAVAWSWYPIGPHVRWHRLRIVLVGDIARRPRASHLRHLSGGPHGPHSPQKLRRSVDESSRPQGVRQGPRQRTQGWPVPHRWEWLQQRGWRTPHCQRCRAARCPQFVRQSMSIERHAVPGGVRVRYRVPVVRHGLRPSRAIVFLSCGAVALTPKPLVRQCRMTVDR